MGEKQKMRKRRSNITKLGFTFVILLLSLASISMSYATWTDTITIEGTISTAEDFNYLCLEGYWKFDEGDGQTAYDSSWNTNDGQLGSTSGHDDDDPLWTAGKINDALDFDGIDDYVDCGNAPSLNIKEGSWGSWLKFDVKPSIAGHLMNPIAKAEQYWIHASNDDSIQAKITVGGTRYIATTGSNFIQKDVWYHVFGTYDGDTLRLYVNGTEIDSNHDPSGNLDTTSNIFAMGTWSSPTDYFQGVIDEVKIYSCALTAGEIWDEYQAGL